MTQRAKTILFTGFEPSGDDHASAVIAELKRRHPGVRVCAWGGPKMGAAGAEIIEQTGGDAVMGVPGLKKILEHKRINRDIEAWLGANQVCLHVPVDSPAANFPICEIARRHGARVVHLVAPQVWAWGSWRVRKLRRLTDFVCCLLPFEQAFFETHGVPAKFVGHPLFDEMPDESLMNEQAAGFPRGERRIALMPGSRPAEIEKNFPLLIEAYRRLRKDYPEITGVVAATREDLEPRLREIAARTRSAPGCDPGWPESLVFTSGRTDAAIRWCDLALVVSGTVTLQIARQSKPMVIVYKKWSRLMYWLVGWWLVRTRYFSLPNLIADRRIVPELMPHFGGPERIVDEAIAMLERPEVAEKQRSALREVVARYEGTNASAGAVDAIERVAGLVPDAQSSRPAVAAAG